MSFAQANGGADFEKILKTPHRFSTCRLANPAANVDNLYQSIWQNSFPDCILKHERSASYGICVKFLQLQIPKAPKAGRRNAVKIFQSPPVMMRQELKISVYFSKHSVIDKYPQGTNGLNELSWSCGSYPLIKPNNLWPKTF